MNLVYLRDRLMIKWGKSLNFSTFCEEIFWNFFKNRIKNAQLWRGIWIYGKRFFIWTIPFKNQSIILQNVRLITFASYFYRKHLLIVRNTVSAFNPTFEQFSTSNPCDFTFVTSRSFEKKTIFYQTHPRTRAFIELPIKIWSYAVQILKKPASNSFLLGTTLSNVK